MSSRARPGTPGQEMFLERPDHLDSPTIEPLKIHKPGSQSPEPRAPSASSQRPGYPKPSTYAAPTSSSSSSGLPYPDDRPQRGAAGRLPYPESDTATTSYSSPQATFALPPMSLTDPSRAGIPIYPPVEQREQAGKSQATPKPLPDSPGPETPEKEDLFQRQPSRPSDSTTGINQRYYPPPDLPGAAGASGLAVPNPASVNRLSSTASTSTTRAQRGSPPPPETPVMSPDDHLGGGIEARYAAAGIAGASTLNNLQAQNAAAAQRIQQYSQQPSRAGISESSAQQPQRPWTPTESPGSNTHGPPTVYQGPGQTSAGGQTSQLSGASADRPSAMEQDFQRLQVTASPPPAYSSVSAGRLAGATTAQGYPNEKRPGGPGAVFGPTSAAAAAAASTAASASTIAAAGVAAGIATGLAATGAAAAEVGMAFPPSDHSAFAHDTRRPQETSAQSDQTSIATENHTSSAAASPSPAMPPLLPEGWISHLDPNSGQYYYIHLPTQSTQWEFPKGPTPLNLHEPLSPAASMFVANPLQSPGLSTFGGKPVGSPGFAPTTPGYAESMMSLASATPTVGGFTGPPPSSGVDVYKVVPTNGVYFGPYLRYTNMDLERGIWLGSILLVTDTPQPPTIHIHQSIDLSPNPRQLKATPISRHQRWTFYKYEVDLRMEDEGSAKWTYAITSHLGCTRYEFLVAGRHEVNWRFVATSGNDFSLNVSVNDRSRAGGVGFMWKDIMAKHIEIGGFHTQLGLGNQINADRLWREIPSLKQWLALSGKENRKKEPWTACHEEDVSHAYFHYYTSHFDQPYLREAFAQIPYVLQIDDHDIFDGFGSYPEYMQFSNMFKNIGRLAIEMYLLFQHHTTLEILRNVNTDTDIFTITGTGWHFVKYLGPAVVVVGPDCRSERNPHQVMAGPTYQGLFPKVALLPPSVQHCIWMISVPVIYPRLDAAEQIAHTVASGKKVVTGAYNVLGKVTSSVAGVVGAKEVVNSGFDTVKRAIGKSGLMGGVLSPFGEIDVLDELRDAWTHESKDLERTYLIRTLQGISKQKGIRMTFLSGSVDCCGAGLVHDPSKPSDHKTMYQLISSSVVNTPPPSYILRLLHNNKQLYVPANGHHSTNAPSDTKEEMMEIFVAEPDGRPREQKKLLGRRNYVAIVAFDPEVVQGSFGRNDLGRGDGRLSLAADFMAQGESTQMPLTKFGPVIIPSLEFGR